MRYFAIRHDSFLGSLLNWLLAGLSRIPAVPADAQYVPAGHLAAIAECWMTVFHRGTIIWEA
jgi:hypothetical protein